MKYEVLWPTKKVIERAKVVMDFWSKIADGTKDKISALPEAERVDKTHNGMPARLRRLADAARSQSWRASILLREANDSVDINGPAGKLWTWTSEDMLWFYPELATSEENLLQLGV